MVLSPLDQIASALHLSTIWESRGLHGLDWHGQAWRNGMSVAGNYGCKGSRPQCSLDSEPRIWMSFIVYFCFHFNETLVHFHFWCWKLCSDKMLIYGMSIFAYPVLHVSNVLFRIFSIYMFYLNSVFFFILCTKEVMFTTVFVSSLTGLCKNYYSDFHKIRWKGGTWATEETVRFWW